MNTIDQVQCLVCWPHLELKFGGIRLASIEASGWASLPRLASARRLHLLNGILTRGLPLTLLRGEVEGLNQEIDDDLNRAPQDDLFACLAPLLTLSMFLDQVLDQTDACARFEIWEGRRFETQVFVEPGTDLLADLLQMADASEASQRSE